MFMFSILSLPLSSCASSFFMLPVILYFPLFLLLSLSQPVAYVCLGFVLVLSPSSSCAPFHLQSSFHFHPFILPPLPSFLPLLVRYSPPLSLPFPHAAGALGSWSRWWGGEAGVCSPQRPTAGPLSWVALRRLSCLGWRPPSHHYHHNYCQH